MTGIRNALRAVVVLAGLAILSACSQTSGTSSNIAALTARPDAVESAGKSGSATTVPIGGGLALDIHGASSPRTSGLAAFASAAASPSKAPVLVYVHGGGWVKGSRAKVYSLPEYARSRGYMLVSLQYRPLPANTLDGQVSDIAKGIRWVRENIASYGGDPARIVIMGHSSGAHLVSMIAARKLGGSLRGVIANDVQAYDLPAYYTMRNNSMDPVYVRAFGHNRATWVKHSPATWVRQGSGGHPPFLILHSGSNGERRKALSQAFANDLRAKGTSVSLFDGRAYTHGTIASHIGKSAAVTRALDGFLQQAFR